MKKKMSIGTIGTSLSRNDMRKIMAGSGSDGYCVPGYACSLQTGCHCSIGFPCCCNGILAGCFTTVSQCQLAC